MKHKIDINDICSECKGKGDFLPIDCPGKPLTDEQIYLILNGKINFKDYKWIDVSND